MSNRKQIADYNRKYYLAHREKAKAYARQWFQGNRRKAYDSRVRYLAEHPDCVEKIKEYDRQRYLKFREEIKDRVSQWNKANPRKRKIYLAQSDGKRRAAKNKVPLSNAKGIKEWFLSWQNKKRVKCYWCLKTFLGKTCHPDHIVPLSKGGAHSLSNLCISCPTCNFSKQARSLAVWNRHLNQPRLSL